MSETDTAKATEAAIDPVEAAPAAVEPPDEASKLPEPPKPRRRSGIGFLALLLGGALAAGGGFALARFVPEGWPLADPPGLMAAQQALAEQQAILDDLQSRLVALEAAPATETDPLLQEVQARVSALEARPEVADVEGLVALKAEVETLRAVVTAPTAQMQAEAEARLADAKAQADAMRAAAEADAAAARREAALVSLRAAFDSGLPLQPALDALGAENVTIPAELTSDVPSLVALQEGFAPAARQALTDARLADPGPDLGSRLTSFLAAQTGARSLSPKEGDSVDAILSRAEAALVAGDLDATLSELQALPQAALPAFETWLADARRRQAAAAALAQMT